MNTELNKLIFDKQLLTFKRLENLLAISLLSYLICLVGLKYCSFLASYIVLALASCLVSIYVALAWPKTVSKWRVNFTILLWLIFPTTALIYIDRLNLASLWPNLRFCILCLYLAVYFGTLILLGLERELTFYLFFGALTTVVSVGSFSLFSSIFNFYGYKYWLVPQTISFGLSLLFAFWVNRQYVFCSHGPIWPEFERFVSSRILSSLLCEYLLMAFLADVVKLNLDLAKISTAFMVVVINYILSKIFVFKQSKVK